MQRAEGVLSATSSTEAYLSTHGHDELTTLLDRVLEVLSLEDLSIYLCNTVVIKEWGVVCFIHILDIFWCTYVVGIGIY